MLNAQCKIYGNGARTNAAAASLETLTYLTNILLTLSTGFFFF